MEIGHRRGWAAAGVGEVSFASDPAGRDREAAGGGRSGSVGDPCLGGKRASFGAKHLPGERAALGPVPWHGAHVLLLGRQRGAQHSKRGRRSGAEQLSITSPSGSFIFWLTSASFLPFLIFITVSSHLSCVWPRCQLSVGTASPAGSAKPGQAASTKSVLLCYLCSWRSAKSTAGVHPHSRHPLDSATT